MGLINLLCMQWGKWGAHLLCDLTCIYTVSMLLLGKIQKSDLELTEMPLLRNLIDAGLQKVWVSV